MVDIAQLVEQHIHNAKVVGLTPIIALFLYLIDFNISLSEITCIAIAAAFILSVLPFTHDAT
ncbi:MAG: hypothetical protein ACSLEM_00425 [Candidatus Malihini olakiniferum]